MSWARIDDGFWSHPKVMAAGLEATGLFVRALSWSCQQLTDGKIPKHMMPALGGGARTKRLEDRLVEVTLWRDGGDHYWIPDFLEYNKSREEVLKKRKEAAERMARGRAKKAASSQGVRTNNDRTSRELHGKFASGSPYPDPTRPDPTPKEETHVDSADAEPDVPAKELKARADAKEVIRRAREMGISWRKPHKFLLAWRKADPDLPVETVVEMVYFFRAKWQYDPKMSQFIRQETLFAAVHRDGYVDEMLAAKASAQPANSTWSPATHCGGSQETGQDSAQGYPLVRRCLFLKGYCDGDHDWSAPCIDGETPQPRERANV